MARFAAWSLLRSGARAPLREVDRFAREHELDQRDRGLLRRLVGTEIRRRGTLRALVRALAHRHPKPEIVTHLHLGLAQIFFFDRVPPHAALSETVSAVMHSVGASKAALVNGILRNALRAKLEGSCGDPCRDAVDADWHVDFDLFRSREEHPYLWAEDALSIPAALMKRWAKRHGFERAERLARTFLHETPLALRVTHPDPESVRAELEAADVPIRLERSSRNWIVPFEATGALTASAAFREGRVTVQGESAARAAELLCPAEGEHLLDLCAAPGGKTALLAGVGAHVVACDVDATRLRRVAETCERLGVAERVRCVTSDGTHELDAQERFDGVLVDAPCSNTGVLAARPNARWRFGPRELASLQDLQARLLAEGAERVRPGGRLVWSTCSLEPEENEQRVRSFLRENPAWSLEEECPFLPDAEGGPWDGGYAARLRRAT